MFSVYVAFGKHIQMIFCSLYYEESPDELFIIMEDTQVKATCNNKLSSLLIHVAILFTKLFACSHNNHFLHLPLKKNSCWQLKQQTSSFHFISFFSPRNTNDACLRAFFHKLLPPLSHKHLHFYIFVIYIARATKAT